MFDYPVILTSDGDTVLVTFPDVPEAFTFGADEDEAQLQVDRLFDLRHASRLDQIEAAARVLGRQLEVRVA